MIPHYVWFVAVPLASAIIIGLHFNETATIVSTIALSSAMWVMIERHALLPIYNMKYFPQPITTMLSHIILIFFAFSVWMIVTSVTGVCGKKP